MTAMTELLAPQTVPGPGVQFESRPNSRPASRPRRGA